MQKRVDGWARRPGAQGSAWVKHFLRLSCNCVPPPTLQARPGGAICRHRACCLEPGRKGPYFSRMSTWIWLQYMCFESLKNPCQDSFVGHRATLLFSQRIIFLIIHLIPSLGMALDFIPIQPIRSSPPQANSSLAWGIWLSFCVKNCSKISEFHLKSNPAFRQ